MLLTQTRMPHTVANTAHLMTPPTSQPKTITSQITSSSKQMTSPQTTSAVGVREAWRKVCTLRTVYTETERALYIHTRQLNLCIGCHGDSNQSLDSTGSETDIAHYEETVTFKHLVHKLKVYHDTLEQCETTLKQSSIGNKDLDESLKEQIWDLKAVKFEPAVPGAGSAIGYLVEYSINDLCYHNHLTHNSSSHSGNYGHGVDKLSGCHGNKLMDLHPDILSSSPSAPNLLSLSSGFVSGGSQLSLLSETAEFTRHDSRRYEKTSRCSGNENGDIPKRSSQGLLWTKKLQKRRSPPASSITIPRQSAKTSRRAVASRAALSTHLATNNTTVSEDVAMLPDGRIVTTDVSNNQLVILNSHSGEVMGELGQHKASKVLGDWKLRPQCVATSGGDPNHVFCTDMQDRCIKRFNVDTGRCTASIPLTNYSRPFGLAVLPDGKFVVSHCDDFITIHDPCTGRTVRTINVGDTGGNFWYVCTDPTRNRIITSDCSNHCVRIFDANAPNGAASIQTLGDRAHAQPEARLGYPHGVAVGKLGQILVADSLNNRVVRFSANGDVIDSVLGDDVIQWPRGLATRGSHVVVTWQGGVSLAEMPLNSSDAFLSSYL